MCEQGWVRLAVKLIKYFCIAIDETHNFKSFIDGNVNMMVKVDVLLILIVYIYNKLKYYDTNTYL